MRDDATELDPTRGQLGAGCQAVLIAAFGPNRNIMSRIGSQWSSIRPLLLAFANSSAVVGGDQRLFQTTLSLNPGAILPVIQQTGFEAVMADGFYNPEATETLAGERHPSVLT
jgi:hypothetical protein